MEYEIKGGNMPVAICTLDAGESLSTDGGAMAWMSPNMEMATEGGGSLGKALGRLISGEKIFRNVYTAKDGQGMIAIAPSLPGSIRAVEITPEKPLIIQKTSFLACTPGVQTEIFLNKKMGTGFFAGEGFVMQRVYGNGLVFLEIDGCAVDYTLEVGQKIIVDTGNLAMMDETCTMDIQSVKGVKNVLFGGEGFFNTVITGPGTVTLQTMPLPELARSLYPFMPHDTSSSNG